MIFRIFLGVHLEDKEIDKMRTISVEFTPRHFPFLISWSSKEEFTTGAEDDSFTLQRSETRRPAYYYYYFLKIGTSELVPF